MHADVLLLDTGGGVHDTDGTTARRSSGRRRDPARPERHVFVSTATGLHSFDAATMAEVGRVDWIGGGRSSRAIGPDGRIDALASDILIVWPGAVQPCRGLCAPPGTGITPR